MSSNLELAPSSMLADIVATRRYAILSEPILHAVETVAGRAGLGLGERWLWLVLYAEAVRWEDWTVRTSVGRLAARLGVSTRTIQRYLRGLEAAGLVSQQRRTARGGRETVAAYRVTLPLSVARHILTAVPPRARPAVAHRARRRHEAVRVVRRSTGATGVRPGPGTGGKSGTHGRDTAVAHENNTDGVNTPPPSSPDRGESPSRATSTTRTAALRAMREALGVRRPRPPEPQSEPSAPPCAGMAHQPPPGRQGRARLAARYDDPMACLQPPPACTAPAVRPPAGGDAHDLEPLVRHRLAALGLAGERLAERTAEVLWSLEHGGWRGTRRQALAAIVRLLREGRWRRPYGMGGADQPTRPSGCHAPSPAVV